MLEMINTQKLVDTAKLVQDNAVEVGKNVVFAGVGVVAMVEENGRQVFENLVAKGKAFDVAAKTPAVVTETMAGVVGKVEAQVKDVVGKVEAGMQDAGKAVLHRVGLPSHDEIQALIARVEALTHKVETLGKKEKH